MKKQKQQNLTLERQTRKEVGTFKIEMKINKLKDVV